MGQLEDMMKGSSIQSGSIASSASTSLDSYIEVSDYGFYDECDPEPDVMTVGHSQMNVVEEDYSSHYATSSQNSSSSKLMKMSSRSSSNDTLSPDASVICLIEDSKAPLVCRSFDSVSVSVALGGLRIVQSNYSEVAEFKVKLNVDGREFVTWRRFNDFQTLGRACAEFSKKQQSRQNMLQNTVLAWQEVEKHRPWWVSPTNIQHLLQESVLIEAFMKNLLYEIPCVQMLLEFVLH